eukprot:5108943-Prymnesium_polylepis.2
MNKTKFSAGLPVGDYPFIVVSTTRTSCQSAPQSARSARYRLTAHHRPYRSRPPVSLGTN